MGDAKRGGVFKRLETDAEYRARLWNAGKRSPATLTASGAQLDAHGDDLGMQRRIVESTCE